MSLRAIAIGSVIAWTSCFTGYSALSQERADLPANAQRSKEANAFGQRIVALKVAVEKKDKEAALKHARALGELLQAEGGLADVVLKSDAGSEQREAILQRGFDAADVKQLTEALEKPGPLQPSHLKMVNELISRTGYHYVGEGGGYGGGSSSDGGYGGYGGVGPSSGYGSGYGGGTSGYGGYGASDGYGGAGFGSAPVAEKPSLEARLQRQIDVLRGQLGQAAPEERAKIIAAVQKLVSEQFDNRTEQRQGQLEQLEARLERLRLQLKRRSEAKDDIVDVRVKTYVNEARGLGF